MRQPYWLLATTLSLVSVATTAVASNSISVRDYPGIRCVEINDSTPSIYYYGQMAENDAASEQDFYCPVSFEGIHVQDYVLTADVMTWSAYVDDSNPSTNVSCLLKSCLEDDSSCYATSLSYSSGSAGVQAMTGSTISSLAGSSRYVSYLRCDIPGKSSGNRSGIVSYRITTDGLI